jgi:hypothetical protein
MYSGTGVACNSQLCASALLLYMLRIIEVRVACNGIMFISSSVVHKLSNWGGGTDTQDSMMIL